MDAAQIDELAILGKGFHAVSAVPMVDPQLGRVHVGRLGADRDVIAFAQISGQAHVVERRAHLSHVANILDVSDAERLLAVGNAFYRWRERAVEQRAARGQPVRIFVFFAFVAQNQVQAGKPFGHGSM